MESYNIFYFITSLFRVAFTYELFYGCVFSFLMGIYLGAELLAKMVTHVSSLAYKTKKVACFPSTTENGRNSL